MWRKMEHCENVLGADEVPCDMWMRLMWQSERLCLSPTPRYVVYFREMALPQKESLPDRSWKIWQSDLEEVRINFYFPPFGLATGHFNGPHPKS